MKLWNFLSLFFLERCGALLVLPSWGLFNIFLKHGSSLSGDFLNEQKGSFYLIVFLITEHWCVHLLTSEMLINESNSESPIFWKLWSGLMRLCRVIIRPFCLPKRTVIYWGLKAKTRILSTVVTSTKIQNVCKGLASIWMMGKRQEIDKTCMNPFTLISLKRNKGDNVGSKAMSYV